MTEQGCFNCKHSIDFAPNVHSATCMDLCRRASERQPKYGDADAFDLIDRGKALDAESSCKCDNCAGTDPCPRTNEEPILDLKDRVLFTDPASIVRSYESWMVPGAKITRLESDHEELCGGKEDPKEWDWKPGKLRELPKEDEGYIWKTYKAPTKEDFKEDDGTMRSFDTGATRDTSGNKLDFEGFLSPQVMIQYAKFMNMNRLQSDGQLRDSDNWQKGIPVDVYIKSSFRHFMEMWETHRDFERSEGDEVNFVAAMCGIMFNVMGYMHEYLKSHELVDFDGDRPTPEMAERKANLESR